ncbi:MAG: hypothetical protein V2L15_02670, partial [Desulfobacteraceae bacterium]|nr:hypothetical protein [Desulfobacteraceae bacterium]
MNLSAISHGGSPRQWMRRLLALGCLLALAAVWVPTVAAADYGYIDLTNPYLRKIPIAIPDFKTVSG